MCRGLEELRREHVLEEEDEERDEDLGDDEPDDDDLEAGAVGVGELRVEDLEELLEDVEALVEELDAVGDVEVVPERDVGRLVFVVLPEPVGAYEREPPGSRTTPKDGRTGARAVEDFAVEVDLRRLGEDLADHLGDLLLAEVRPPRRRLGGTGVRRACPTVSSLGHVPLDVAHFWTSDHLSGRS